MLIFFLSGPQRICIFKEEFLKKILVTNSKKYLRASVIPNTFPTIANGLFASNGKEHAWQRKLINPIFSYSSVLGFVKAFDTNTANLIKVTIKKLSDLSLRPAAEPWGGEWGVLDPPLFLEFVPEIHTKIEKISLSVGVCQICHICRVIKQSNECSKRKSILKLAKRVFSMLSES